MRPPPPSASSTPPGTSRVTRAPARIVAAGAADRLAERLHQPARVDGVVAGDVERQPDRRRERRLGAARLRRAAAARRRARAAAGTRAGGRAPPPRRGRARRRACPVRRSPGSAPDASASSAQNAGKPRRRAQAQVEQRVLAEVRLGDRREHARGDVPRARHRPRRARRPAGRAGRRATRSPARSDRRRRRRRPAWPAPATLRVDSFPTPVRPGSGSTVGAPMAPSQPESGLPYAQSVARSACLTTH